MKLETRLIHAGAEIDPTTGAVAPPIHLSTTFLHGPGGELPTGYCYVREGNPTQARLEAALAEIEEGEAAVFFASGMAAAAALFQTLERGDHAVVGDDLYFGVRQVVRQHLPRWGVEATEVDASDLEAVRAALRPETRLVWVETPTNPFLKVADVAALARLAHGAGARLAVDSTFASPVLQQPLALGADAAVHSATKYLGGHSDVQGGAVVVRDGGWAEELVELRTVLGGTASPFNAWLVLRGLRTLACRMERQSASALEIARALAGHEGVEAVHYPGLPQDPGHEVAARQMKAFGGMVSMRVRGGRERAVAAAARLRLFTNATSLGGVESLVEHRASIEGPATTAPQNLLRLSIGLEHPGDLLADLAGALAP